MALVFRETFDNAAYFPKANGAINQIYGFDNHNTESGDAHGGVATVDNATYDFGWSLTRVTSPVFSGARAVKFEIREAYPLAPGIASGRVRSEVRIIKPQSSSWWPGYPSSLANEMWYAYAIYFPTTGMENDPDSHDTITQWFEDGGDDCTIKVRNGKVYLEMIHPSDNSKLNHYDLFGAVDSAPNTSVPTSFTNIPRDQWHVFVFHYIHSQSAGGLIEIYRDGVKIQTINGRNMHTSILPKWTLGIYKSDYTSNPGQSIRPTRILYFDDIRLGDSDSVLADMMDLAGPAPNIPPVADAGPNQTKTLPTSTATLNGSGSFDSDGSISTYAWSKISGPSGGTITSPSSATTGVTSLQAGTYVYQLTVTDNDGATDTDTVTIVVNPIGYPVAEAGNDQSLVLPTNTANLDGSASTDPDGTVTGYVWTKLSGPACSITSPSSANTGVTGLLAGTYVFRLTVTDNDGNTDTDDVIITVDSAPLPANIPPVSDAGADQIISSPLTTATLSGSGSTDDDDIGSFAWSFISGPNTPSITSPFSGVTGVTGLVIGTYVFRLTVTNLADDIDTDDVTITVTAAAETRAPLTRLFNTTACFSDIKNTGFSDCNITPKNIRGCFEVPKTFRITTANLSALQDYLKASTLLHSKGLRIFPVHNFDSLTDSSEDDIYQSTGYGDQNFSREGRYDWTFTYSEGGECLHAGLRTRSVKGRYVIFYDADNNLFGWNVNGDMGGIPLGIFKEQKVKINDGTNSSVYALKFVFNATYLNEEGLFFKADFLLNEINGIKDIELFEAVSSTGGVFEIAARLNCSKAELFDIYEADLTNAALWSVTNSTTGLSIAITGITANSALQCFSIALDTDDDNYPISGNISVSLVAPAVLDAAGIEGYESNILIATT